MEAPANSGGRLLLGYLALNRFWRIDREELLTAVYAGSAVRDAGRVGAGVP